MTTSPFPPNGHYKTADIDLATAIYASGIRPLDTTEYEGLHTVFTFPKPESELTDLISRYSNFELLLECHRLSQCRRGLLRLAHGGRL
jgi:hypothetical protein